MLVHEWNDHELVRRIGLHHRQNRSYALLFHDTHHRAVTDKAKMSEYDLSNYDGVLAFGGVIRDLYLSEGWAKRALTLHEAADTRTFSPLQRDSDSPTYDIVWIGNWGDEERTAELHEFLIEPACELGLRVLVHGVRYPKSALAEVERHGIDFVEWLPNFAVPQAFAQRTLTVHVPRRPYTESLPGIPTIRPFEALACGIPLISAFWEDKEKLFTPGKDFLFVRDGNEMKSAMEHLHLLEDGSLRRNLIEHGLRTIHSRHTCAHRVDELMGIYEDLKAQERTTGKRAAAV